MLSEPAPDLIRGVKGSFPDRNRKGGRSRLSFSRETGLPYLIRLTTVWRRVFPVSMDLEFAW